MIRNGSYGVSSRVSSGRGSRWSGVSAARSVAPYALRPQRVELLLCRAEVGVELDGAAKIFDSG